MPLSSQKIFVAVIGISVQEPEQVPGSVIVTSIVQVGSIASVSVIFIFPPPAVPAGS